MPIETSVLTPREGLRCRYPHLFTPQKSSFEGGKDKYSIVLLIPKTPEFAAFLKQLRTAMAAAATKEWGAKDKWPKSLRNPIRDGDEKDHVEGYPGNWFITASSDDRPGVVNQDLVELVDRKSIRDGYYVRVDLNAFAYNSKANRGVSFGLNNVQLVKKAETFGGAREASSVFEKIDGGDEPDWGDDGDGGDDPFGA